MSEGYAPGDVSVSWEQGTVGDVVPSSFVSRRQRRKACKEAIVPGPVNLNTADEATLTSLKGIGAVKAKAIIAYRQQNGPFKSVDDLKKVPGIGDKLLAQLKDQVTVGK